jgi:hypothetical protein
VFYSVISLPVLSSPILPLYSSGLRDLSSISSVSFPLHRVFFLISFCFRWVLFTWKTKTALLLFPCYSIWPCLFLIFS